MKVCFISPYFYPLRGGTESNCYNMAVQTKALGHDVTVFTSDRKGDKKFERKAEEINGIKVFRLRRILFNKYYLTLLLGLFRNLHKTNPDIIHSHIPGIVFTDMTLMLHKLLYGRRTTYINTPHDPFMSRDKYKFTSKLLKNIYTPILRMYYRRLYDYVIAVNSDQIGWIKEMYKVPEDRIIVVENGVDEKIFEILDVDKDILNQYELTDKLVISCVARYHEYKGYQNILEALTKIRNKKQLNIKFVGIGEDSGMLKRLNNYIVNQKLEKYVELIESPNDYVRDQILQKSEIFILASRLEAFGISIIEAMAKGNAIITTNTEGGKYLVNSRNGIRYEFDNIDELASAIVKLAEEKELRESLIKTNLNKSKNFSWKRKFVNYKELLEIIMNQ